MTTESTVDLEREFDIARAAAAFGSPALREVGRPVVEPGDAVLRLRRRKQALERFQERAEQTLVAETASGAIVIACPGQPLQWELATDPIKGPTYLRESFGLLDASSVKLMSETESCKPGNPWTDEEEQLLAAAEAIVRAKLARQVAEGERTRPERDARAAEARAAERERRAEYEAKWGSLVSAI